MKRRNFQMLGNAVILVGLLGFASVVYPQHHVYLEVPNSIPSYCQETGIWCGAATGQMILEGYPGGIEHPYTQTHIWNRIQVHNDDPGVNWATEPHGLRETLMELGGDPGVNWVINTNSNPQSLMYSVTYWMTERLYPVAALVFGFQHWIAITGITTDLDPTTNNNVTLQWVEIIDPGNPHCPSATSGGIKSWMNGTNWYANYWFSPGDEPSSQWDDNYLAIIEPPIHDGSANAPRQVEKGRVISDSIAQGQALNWIKKLSIEEKEPYSILLKIKPLHPLLVNADYKGYYIVPFGYEDGQLSQGAILINAYDGDFQEIGIFQKPLTYLHRERAIKIASDYVCSCNSRGTARLLFQYSEQSRSRFLPVWEVTVEIRFWLFFKRYATVYVTQQEEVFDQLTQLPLGD